MIPPLFLQPPVDKSFSFIAQTQGLQVHRPQKGEEGGRRGVKGIEGWRRGWEREWSVGDMRERKEQSPATPGSTSTSHPCLHPSPVPTLQHLSVLLCRLATHDRSANCKWCRLALPCLPHSVCGSRQGAGVAERPWGETGPFLLNQQRSSNDYELQLCPLRLALPWPAVAPQPHLTMSPSACGLCCCWRKQQSINRWIPTETPKRDINCPVTYGSTWRDGDR